MDILNQVPAVDLESATDADEALLNHVANCAIDTSEF